LTLPVWLLDKLILPSLGKTVVDQDVAVQPVIKKIFLVNTIVKNWIYGRKTSKDYLSLLSNRLSYRFE
jgi:hypothetical protein